MFDVRVVVLLLLLQISFSLSEGTCTGSAETCLMKHLKGNMETQDIDVRPVFNYSEPVNVQFGIALIGIDGVEHVGLFDYKVTVSCWFRHLWKDMRLSWDPADFGGVDHIRIPIKYIWKPDFVLFNNYELEQQINTEAMAVVYSDGTVLWIPMAKMTARAVKESSSFMSDEIYGVAFRYGSWTYDAGKLDIGFYDDLEEFDLGDFVSQNVFSIVEQSAERFVMYYPCCEEAYPALIYSLRLKVL